MTPRPSVLDEDFSDITLADMLADEKSAAGGQGAGGVSAPLAIDLFSGLGGWASGLTAAGWRVVGFDLEDMHRALGEPMPDGDFQLVIQNVLTLHGRQFRGAGLIVASPPCQAYSYMAMPWSRAKAKAAALRADVSGKLLSDLNALFDACFRIQREACEAAGRHIPMVVENVRGAIPWVGRSRWNFGSYHLWGDVPALMPLTANARKVPGFRFDGSGGSFQTASVDHLKAPGGGHIRDGAGHTARLANPAEGRKHHGDWFRDPDCPSRQGGQSKPPARVSDREPAPGRKSVGSGAVWFDQNIASLPSASPRKAASARIAKIPFTLARWIATVARPESEDA